MKQINKYKSKVFLKNLPIHLMFTKEANERPLSRSIENNFYGSKETIAIKNYKPTSRMIDIWDLKNI